MNKYMIEIRHNGDTILQSFKLFPTTQKALNWFYKNIDIDLMTDNIDIVVIKYNNEGDIIDECDFYDDEKIKKLERTK